MTPTGIIRRTDDLGRVVIPKELRRRVGIKDGEPLEILICENGVFFRKLNDNKQMIQKIEEILDELQVFNAMDDAPLDSLHKISTGLRESKKWIEKNYS